MCLLEVQNLTIASYKSSEPLLNKINIKIKAHQITALIGESGSGKTILSRTISGLLPEKMNLLSGDFFFENKLVGYRWIQKNRGKKIFYSPQNAAASLNPILKIKNQVNESLRIDKEKLSDIFNKLDFYDEHRIMNSYPFELSGGENQRCLLAVALAISPLLLILDEPINSLDTDAQRKFMNLLTGIHNQFHMTTLIITHNLELIKKIAGYLYIIWKGSIIDEGKIMDIFSHPNHQYTKEIVGYF